MSDLHAIELIDKTTMRGFDARCLTTIEDLSPGEITDLRRSVGVSQGVFAHYLNVKPKLVSEWERGEKKAEPTFSETAFHRQGAWFGSDFVV